MNSNIPKANALCEALLVDEVTGTFTAGENEPNYSQSSTQIRMESSEGNAGRLCKTSLF